MPIYDCNIYLFLNFWKGGSLIQSQRLLAVGDDGDRRGEDVKELAVGDVDKKDEAWNHMKIPEKISIDLYISEKLRHKVSTKRDPVVCAGRSEVGHINPGLDDFRVSDSITLNQKTRNF